MADTPDRTKVVAPWLAVLIGQLWVNGSAALGFGTGFACIGLLYAIGRYAPVADALGLWLIMMVLLISFVCSWLAWSWQITRWRLWAYARVADVAELKRLATGSLTWPDGHPFERTEFRSRDQAAELARLEALSKSTANSRSQG